MASVDAFLSAPLFAGEVAARFQRETERLRSRHRGWRRNFPAVGVLLDSDEERARALAGNFATEAREIIGVWLALRDDDGAWGGDAAPPAATQARWIDGYARAWHGQVLESDAFSGLEDAPREHFRGVFEELMERFRREALDYVRAAPAGVAPGDGLAARLLRPLAAAGRALRSFFLPRLQ